MKKFYLYLILGVMGLWGAWLYAASEDFKLMAITPQVNTYVAQTVFISSNSNANNSTPGNAVFVSSVSSILHSVTINSAGASGATLELWNSFVSSTTFERKIATIDGTSKTTLSYDVYCPSGIIVNNSNPNGTAVADFTVSWRRR